MRAALHALPYTRTCQALLLATLLMLCGCSGTSRIPQDDALFTGFSVKVNDEGDTSNRRKQLETELSGTVRPEPNFSILGIRPKLAIYNTFYTEKDKGLKHWIQTKLGEPPVLISTVDTASINQIMSARLHNRGYFNNTVQSKTTIKKKTATIDWAAYISEPYRIRQVVYTVADDSLQIQNTIEQTRDQSLLVKGEPYDLEKMTAERVRIDANLKNKGYYYFSPDMLIFSADTAIGNRQVDVLMRLKNNVPAQNLRPYTIDDIYIFANYNLGDSLSVSDTISFKGYKYIPNENYVRARHLLRGVFVEQDSLYSREDHLLTINRLSALPAYKFVNIDYKPDTANPGKLDSFIYLTPAYKKSLRLEGKYVSKSNNFAGPGLTASFRNRNALKGSELLNIEFTGNFESQVGGRGSQESTETQENTNTNLSSYELGAQASLTFPRIISPFKLRNLRTEFLPKTRMTLGFNFLNRVRYFQMNSFNASYAYNWRPKKEWTHDLTPINLQYVKLVRVTDEFQELLDQNTFLSRSFEDQFIIGSIYQLTFSNQMETNRTHQFFDNIILDGSGNLINALHNLSGADEPEDDKPRTIAGRPYSQYVRVENDFRYYFNFGTESQIATRLLAGVGYAHGNSTVLPYIKQFSIGGPNSIRAFRARSIGPGTYDITKQDADSLVFSYFDQVGDMKLEANIEYRFPIAGFFKGAVFLDAGNIWLLKNTYNEKGEIEKPGGKFDPSKFLSQLAIGTGFGLRVDVEFFVIRFDLGIPVQVPYAGNVLSDFKFGFKGDNSMTLNIAIGYPF